MERIHAYNRDIKLIVSLRDPVERAYSHWRMEKARGAELLSFTEAIRQGRSRVEEHAEIDVAHRVFSYVERGFYAEQLSRMYRFFPSENILLLRQRDMAENLEVTLEKLCRFLSISSFENFPDNKSIFSHSELQIEPMSLQDRLYLEGVFFQEKEILRTDFKVFF